MRLTDRQFWERRWSVRAETRGAERVDTRTLPFHDLLVKVLPRGGTYLEVGCAPGRNMAYFHRYFGYDVAGVDYVAEDLCRRTLEANAVAAYQLFRLDFLEDLPPGRYDVVASFGFVEHFTDLRTVVSRHVALVKPGGHVVIGVPNMRWGQHAIRRLLDPASLRRHNLEAMKCGVMRRLLGELGARAIVYCGHYRTFGVWSDREDLPGWVTRGVGLCDAGFQRVASALHADNLPTPFLSPYVLTIARF